MTLTRRAGMGSILAGTLLAASPARAGSPLVWIQGEKDVWIRDGSGERKLTISGSNRDPALSTDGRMVAYVHDEPGTDPEAYGYPKSTLWVCDLATGANRQVARLRASDEMGQDFSGIASPVFSLDGGFIYVLANAWVTSAAVHQVNLKTGAEHFVIDGNSVVVIRTGPYRGYLLVNRHHYPPQGPATNPTYVVRPDARVAFAIPGSEDDESGEVVQAWLKRKGWTAS